MHLHNVEAYITKIFLPSISLYIDCIYNTLYSSEAQCFDCQISLKLLTLIKAWGPSCCTSVVESFCMDVLQEVHNCFSFSFYCAGFNSSLVRGISLSLNDNFQWLISDFRPLLLLLGLELCFSGRLLLCLHVVHCHFHSWTCKQTKQTAWQTSLNSI